VLDVMELTTTEPTTLSTATNKLEPLISRIHQVHEKYR
jgi:hypothetical protein